MRRRLVKNRHYTHRGAPPVPGVNECNRLLSSTDVLILSSQRNRHCSNAKMTTTDVVVFAINLLILAVPTVMLAVAWNRLADDWRKGIVQSTAGTLCLAFASASTLVALGSLFWQVFVRPIPWRDYRTEVSGLLLSVVSLVSGFSTRDKHQHRYWRLGLAAAVWMFLWFVATAFSY
jgi:hypothetical protein